MYEGVAVQISKELDKYSEELQQKIEKVSNQIATETVKRLKETSPRGKGRKHYADGWKKKKVTERRRVGYIAYNATKPGLTYLLNNGHDIIAGGRTVGRVEGDNHIGKANEWAIAEFERRLEDEL